MKMKFIFFKDYDSKRKLNKYYTNNNNNKNREEKKS
jgi:hypothetical protein